MPDILRWLWRGYPQPIVQNTPELVPVPAGRGGGGRGPMFRQPAYKSVVTPDKPWETVTGDYSNATGIAVNKTGDVFFADSKANRIYRVAADGKPTAVFV